MNRPQPPHDRHACWLIRDLVVAVVVSILVGCGMLVINARSDEQQRQHAEALAVGNREHSGRLENLRFVRDRSSPDPNQQRPFEGLDLRGQSLAGLQLAGAVLDGADLAGADLDAADLEGASLSGALLSGAHANGTNLASARLHHADLAGAELHVARLAGADLTSAQLIGADLEAADLTAANLIGARLLGADLTEICFDEATRWPTGYVPPPSRTDDCPAR